MIEIYHELCKECEYLYHCFDRNTVIKIQNNDIKKYIFKSTEL